MILNADYDLLDMQLGVNYDFDSAEKGQSSGYTESIQILSCPSTKAERKEIKKREEKGEGQKGEERKVKGVKIEREKKGKRKMRERKIKWSGQHKK